MAKKTLTLAIIILFTITNVSSAIASISPDSGKTCSVVGTVTNVKTRKEPGRGLSDGKTFTYIDVTVSLTETKNEKSCASNDKGENIFQMDPPFLGRYAPSIPKKGTCIKGSAKIMADGNFMSGHWLTVEEKLPAEACE